MNNPIVTPEQRINIDCFRERYGSVMKWEAVVVTSRVFSERCGPSTLGADIGAIQLDDYHKHPNTTWGSEHVDRINKWAVSAAVLITSCRCSSAPCDRYEASCLIDAAGLCSQGDPHEHASLLGHTYDRLEYRRVLELDRERVREACPDRDDYHAVMEMLKGMFGLRRVAGSYGSRSVDLLTTEPEVLVAVEHLPSGGSLTAYLLETVREQRKRECEQVQAERESLVVARQKYKEAKSLVLTRLRGMSPRKASPTPQISAS